MIVDDLRRFPEYRRLLSGAQVFRVPFRVFPLHPSEPEVLSFDAQDTDKLYSLCPKNAQDQMDSSWWRPPFPKMVIASERDERGVLFAMDMTEEFRAFRPNDIHRDWVYLVGLAHVNQYDRMGIAVAVYMCGVDGLCGFWDGVEDRVTALTSVYNMIGSLPDGYLSVEDMQESVRERIQHKVTTPAAGRIGTMFVTTCALLACRNITPEEVRPPARLQAARQRRGQLPLITYRVLKVRRSGPVRRSNPRGSTAGEPLALHWVRGHFKTYTSERPLLGRATGTYWWSPHLAGQADRVALKDYEVPEL